MRVEEYIIGAEAWVWPAVGAGVIIAVAAIANYLSSGLTAWRGVALFLKLSAVAVLAICLVEPRARGTRPQPQENLLPVLVDASHSMRVKNTDADTSDAQRLQKTLAEQPGWLINLEQMFDMRRYLFGDRLRSVSDFTEIPFEDNRSHLRIALQTLAQRFGNRPVAGCVLFTDGNWTDAAAEVDWTQLGFPIFVVRDPDDSKLRDLRISTVAVSETNFETAPVTLTATIVAQQLAGRQAVVRLLSETGELVEEQEFEVVEDGQNHLARFRFRPESAGVSFYRLECVLSDEPDVLETRRSKWEATVENNHRLITVNQDRGPFPVLYVAGRPNWEFKYIRRAIEEDAEVRLVGLLRIAKRQPKFSFRDASVDSSANPLFAGLGGSEEEAAEQLDEAVIVRLGVDEATELAGGFPDDPEDLYPFAAVILDDVEAGFFTQDQLLLLRRFVSTRGGALLMLGGDDALEKGGYGDTPLGELAPVYLPRRLADDDDLTNGLQGDFKLQLTREGMLQPFLRLRDTEEAEQKRLKQAPPLKVLNRIKGIKPGAVVLATAEDTGGQTAPALVTQPFGRGRTASLLVGDLWRWSLQRGTVFDGGAGPLGNPGAVQQDVKEEDPPQVWRQLVRWLVSDVSRRLEARIEPGEVPETVAIRVQVRAADFSTLDGAQVKATIENPEKEKTILELEPVASQPGVYQVEYWPRHPGGYRAMIAATGPDGEAIGEVETGWSSDPAAEEFEKLGSNQELLEQLTSQTGGEIIPLSQVDQLADRLTSQPVPVEEAWEYPVWHRWWVCALALVCLCGEWGIRRWKGLP